MSAFTDQGIGYSVHFIPIYEFTHVKTAYGFSAAEYPQTAAYFAGALSLPLYPTLTDADQNEIISLVRRVLAGSAGAKGK